MLRWFTLIVVILMLGAACTQAAPPASDLAANSDWPVPEAVMTVYKSPTCGCCTVWTQILRDEGFTVEEVSLENVAPVKVEHGVPVMLQSCHTAVIDGYVIEGHVPPTEIKRLLHERPDVAGLAVPGMPIGSPGMEVEGVPADSYDVLAFDDQGQTEIFASY